MYGKISTLVVLALLLSPVSGSGIPQPTTLPNQMGSSMSLFGLNDDQIRTIREGKPLAKGPGFAHCGSGLCLWLRVHSISTPELYSQIRVGY